jgi:hypothetical protein
MKTGISYAYILTGKTCSHCREPVFKTGAYLHVPCSTLQFCVQDLSVHRMPVIRRADNRKRPALQTKLILIFLSNMIFLVTTTKKSQQKYTHHLFTKTLQLLQIC